MKPPFELTPLGAALCALSSGAGYLYMGNLRGALTGFVCATATVAAVQAWNIARRRP